LGLITVEEGEHDHIILYHCTSGFFLKRGRGRYWFVRVEKTKEIGEGNICYV
jgi:hypothetical protein